MTPAAFAVALVMGALMGLLGGGGSIVAVPALTLLLGLPAKDAVVTSLLVVGIAAVAGAISAWLRGLLPVAIAFVVGGSAMVGALGGGMVGAQLPDHAQLMILAIVMVVAAVVLWMHPSVADVAPRSPNLAVLGGTGVGIGALTGLVGVGGGFLMVPAMVLAGGLPMSEAAGVSLFVIALSAASALPAYAAHAHLQWHFVGPFALTTSAVVLAAGPLAARLPQRLLQQAFAVTLVILSTYLLLRG